MQFDLSRDINADAQFVQTAINEAGGLLPKGLPNPPTYEKTNPARTPVLIYAIHSEAMPRYQMDTYANVMLAEQLSTVSGVGQVIIAGQQQPAVHIEVNPQALAERGIGLEPGRRQRWPTRRRRAKGQSRRPSHRISRSTPTISCSTRRNSAM